MDPSFTLGERIAYHRRRRGLSQKEFGAELGRSESWVSQVERGARSIDRLSVLQQVADVLGVPVADLRRDEDQQEAGQRGSDVEELRLALAGHPALDAVLNSAPPQEADLRTLQAQHDRIWPLLHEARYDQLEPILAELIPQLETAVRTADRSGNVPLYEMLASTYQAAAAMLARLHESDAAWVAADRAIHLAERQGNPLVVVAGLFRMTHAFLGMRQLSEARRVAHVATEALMPRADSPDAPPELLSLYGALHLALAVVAARDNDRRAARGHLDAARTAAQRNGVDRNDYGTEFGPTNVAIHAVSVAVDLGDAGEAVELANGLDVTALSPERQFRLHLDIARAETQRRHIGEAIASLIWAEKAAPEQFQNHPLPRATVQDLLQMSGRRIPSELKDLARRLGLMPR